MAKNIHKPHKKETRQASTAIALGSAVGLTVCFVYAIYSKVEVPLVLYAIFGGGILGTDNVVSVLKTIFRVGK